MLEPKIGKRAIFVRNLKRLTRQKDIQKALKGWNAVRLVRISERGKEASCELCGTRFKFGALMRYPATRVVITVGGICTQVLHRNAFTTPAGRRTRSQRTWQLFRAHYYEKNITRGAWLTWIFAHAPGRLASIVLDLKYHQATLTDEDMQKLIDFHDAYRKYPAEALVDEWKLFIKLGIKVPEYLSLRQARRLLASKAVTNNRDIIKARLARFRRKMVLPRIRCYRDETRAWESLSLSAKRVVTALAYLSENSRANEAESLFSLFLPPKVRFSRPQFVWNPAVGLGCIGMNDRDGTAHIRLWSDESVKRYDLHYFRSVSFDSERVVAGLEGIALGKR